MRKSKLQDAYEHFKSALMSAERANLIDCDVQAAIFEDSALLLLRALDEVRALPARKNC